MVERGEGGFSIAVDYIPFPVLRQAIMLQHCLLRNTSCLPRHTHVTPLAIPNPLHKSTSMEAPHPRFPPKQKRTLAWQGFHFQYKSQTIHSEKN